MFSPRVAELMSSKTYFQTGVYQTLLGELVIKAEARTRLQCPEWELAGGPSAWISTSSWAAPLHGALSLRQWPAGSENSVGASSVARVTLRVLPVRGVQEGELNRGTGEKITQFSERYEPSQGGVVSGGPVIWQNSPAPAMCQARVGTRETEKEGM